MSCRRHSAWVKAKNKHQRPVSEYLSGKIQNLFDVKVVDNAKTGKSGLENQGNSCYINTVLQCLSNAQPLTDFFLSRVFREDFDEKSTNGEFSNAFNDFLEAQWLDEYESIAPIGILELTWGTESFVKGTQSDCHEFQTFFLNEIHSELNRCKNEEQTSVDAAEENIEVHSLLHWKEHLAHNSSIIVDLFHGQLISSIKCSSCTSHSTSFDVFSTLVLPIPAAETCNLLECFNQFSKSENLVSDEKWKCSKCPENRIAVKKIELWKIPPILTICLKRFSSEGVNCTNVKLSKEFNISQITRNKVRDTYKLFAAISYVGTGQNGHYYADVMNYKDKKWNRFDDESVQEIDINQIDGEKVCVLFYYSCKSEFVVWNPQRVNDEIVSLQTELTRKNSQIDLYMHGSTFFSMNI